MVGLHMLQTNHGGMLCLANHSKLKTFMYRMASMSPVPEPEDWQNAKSKTTHYYFEI